MPFNAKSINIKSSVIEGSSSETFIGIAIDSNFTFEKQINELCKKGNLKITCSCEMCQNEYRKEMSDI